MSGGERSELNEGAAGGGRAWSVGRGVELAVSPPVVLMVVLAVLSTALVMVSLPRREAGLSFWLFSPDHQAAYVPVVNRWNASAAGRGAPGVTVRQLSTGALQQRILGSFFSGARLSDLVEVERRMAGQIFAGPVEGIRLVDLTDRLRAEGLLDDPTTGRRGRIPAAAFTPWTTRGRVFGLPHDIHPVVLCYRADIIEGAGIDVNGIETWEDFKRVLSPLMRDEDGDGQPEHRLIGYWSTHEDKLEMMLLQAGGGFFDEDGSLVLDSEVNARVVAELGTWMHGPNAYSEFPIAADVRDFDPIGNRQKIEARALCYLMPDWMCHIWKRQMPEIAGKVKLMKLPAWERGGKRASVWGGTMLAISAGTEDPEAAWELAKELYYSADSASRLYEQKDIVTPLRDLWEMPVFSVPDGYFGGQAKAKLYMSVADDVPVRASSPFFTIAYKRANIVVQEMERWAGGNPGATMEQRLEKARELLGSASEVVRRAMERNAFHRDSLGDPLGESLSGSLGDSFGAVSGVAGAVGGGGS